MWHFGHIDKNLLETKFEKRSTSEPVTLDSFDTINKFFIKWMFSSGFL